jgi:glucosamine-6-phosphate deaminase
VETWKSGKVSIWHPGWHDNPFGMRLTTLMLAKLIPDSPVPMSLVADHPDVQFIFYRPGIGTNKGRHSHRRLRERRALCGSRGVDRRRA